jgi:hypothetical protein
VIVRGLPDFGYFSISALTNDTATDDHDFFRLRTQSRSARLPENGTDFATINRKVLEDVHHQKLRKSGAMPLTKSYLAGDKVADFSDSLRVVHETLWRANQTITKLGFGTFVNSSLLAKIENAKEHIEFANATFSEIKTVLDGLWDEFQSELIALQVDAKEQFGIATRDLVNFAKILAHGGDDSPASQEAFRKAMGDATDPGISILLLGICLVEGLGFGAFFMRRLRKAQSPKKVE